eukprot:950901_1
MERTYLLYQLIVIQTYWIVALPFYACGIIKWELQIRHLMIYKRFPFISLLMIVSSFLNGSLLLVLSWKSFMIKYDLSDHVINEAFSFFIYGLINLRLFLTFMRWKTNQNILHLEIPPSNVRMTKTRSLYYHWVSILILLLSILGALSIAIFPKWILHARHTTPLFYSIMMLINLTLIAIICVQKVKDGIGCLKESVIMLLVFIAIFAIGLLQPLIQLDTVQYIAFAVLHFSPWFQGLFPLFSPLYYIRQLEHVKTREENPSGDSSVNVDIQKVSKEGRLYEFLREHRNYVVFQKYVSHCWASENLSFLVHSQILKQTVKKYAEMTTGNAEKYPLHFVYLKASYAAIQERIDTCIGDGNERQVEFTQVRDLLYDLHREIYDEFVDDGAENAINVSHDARRCLSSLFGKNANKEKFQCFEDFVNIFDATVLEIYR